MKAKSMSSIKRCGYQISSRLICCCYPIRGFDHCRHHLTDEEKARRERASRG